MTRSVTMRVGEFQGIAPGNYPWQSPVAIAVICLVGALFHLKRKRSAPPPDERTEPGPGKPAAPK